MSKNVTEEQVVAALVYTAQGTCGTSFAEELADEADLPLVPRVTAMTFEETGVLTMNKGLVIQVGDQEFQLTVVRSK